MTQGRKFDGGKLRYDLVPVLAYEQIAKVLTAGAQKYADNNWIQVPEGRKRYMAASIRHQQQYRKGEIYDPETGVHHLICSAVNNMFIAEKDLQGWDDIPDDSTEKVDMVAKIHEDESIVPVLESALWYPDDSGEWVEYDAL